VSFRFGGANARYAELAYWTGVRPGGFRRYAESAESWSLAAAPPASGGSPQTYYQGLAFQKLGNRRKPKLCSKVWCKRGRMS